METNTQDKVIEGVENTEQTAESQENETVETEIESNEETVETPVSAEEELKIKLAEANDKFLRLYSEFDNFRKRTAREKIELSKTAGEDIFKTILPVLDDFERGLKSVETATDIEAVKEGMNLIFQKMRSTMQQKGLTEMKSIGETFDADIHEAITNIPAADDSMKGKVVDELEKGYMLNGKVIRFAKVIVAQ